uniref:Endonuclease/exonuclease/phosphatase domain-containing protein n=1 Tax=Micrurus spixii TaxID=129469 RepID=A0A2D4LBZ5_9SAUR
MNGMCGLLGGRDGGREADGMGREISGAEVGQNILVVIGRGRYGGSHGAGHFRGTRTCCIKAITCSSPLDSSPMPGDGVAQGPGLRLLLLNARSFVNKAPLVWDLILDEEADLTCITETWLGQDGGVPLSEMCPDGFQIMHQP